MFRKNTAGQFIHVQGVDSTNGAIKSGVTWTVRRCIDGTFAAATGTAAEDGTTGWYKFAMSQADTNGNNIGFNFTGTGAIPQTVNIVTTACDPTSTAFGLVIAKTTNITGFNDIAATAVVSAGAITTLSGAVANVDLVDLCTTTTTATNLTNLPTIPANWLTAAGTAADFGTELATAVWTDTTAADFTVALSIGKSVMNGVALGTGLTINAYTGNTVQTGDSFVRIGAAGVSLTSVALADATSDAVIADAVWNAATVTYGGAGSYGALVETGNVGGGAIVAASVTGAVGSVTGLTASNLDATITSRMATYTQPTGFLAATFPTTVASTTNITGGTITTTTNLTTNNDKTGYALSAAGSAALTEGYAADGVAPTLAQAIFAIQQFQQEKSITGTTLTVKKLDGATTALTFTLDSSTAPTSITRAT